MMIGTTATAITFVALAISITAYFLYYRHKDSSLLRLARISIYSASGLIVFQSILLMWGILTHRFEWVYVFSYSSSDLPLYYLISTFWAGQEGTFLLWLLLGSAYGWFIIRRNEEDEPLVMSFMNLVQAYIVMILIKRNPFSYVWEINPGGFAAGQIPMDGNGLNPLLQDPWMTIHPPVLFVGYSSTMIIFAFAMAALVKRNYDSWIKNAYPYALFVGLSLGAGIILGGYWAYTTLGWGGYWAWDPVENSSLIPWLLSLALIHGLIIQKRRGGLKKTNLFIALSIFVLVLYGSFLTRSGVLMDFSVHSFGTSELHLYLAAFVVFFLVLGALFFLFRRREIQGEKVQSALFSRESFMLYGMMSLLLLAFLTLVGTSSPLITGFFGEASNVSIDYYNRLAGPLAIVMAFLIALSPVLNWKRNSQEKLKGLIWHSVLSLVSGLIVFILGMRDIMPLIITVLSFFVIFVNGEIVWRMVRRKLYGFGGYLAHVGVGLMLIGIITSSVYDQSAKILLPMDTETAVLGYNLSYGGKQPSADGKDRVKLAVEGKTTFAKYYWSDYSRAYMVGPAVQNKLIHDLYIAPIQIIPAEQNMPESDQVILKKNEPQTFEEYRINFSGYDMDHLAMSEEHMHIAALIEISTTERSEIIRPALVIRGNQSEAIPARWTDSERDVFIAGISVEDDAIALGITKSNSGFDPRRGKELLAVEVTVKPLINILWLGTVILVMGFGFAIYQQSNSRRKTVS